MTGDVAGKYDQLFNRVRNVNKKAGPFEVASIILYLRLLWNLYVYKSLVGLGPLYFPITSILYLLHKSSQVYGETKQMRLMN